MKRFRIRIVLRSFTNKIGQLTRKVVGIPGRLSSFLVNGWNRSLTGRTMGKLTKWIYGNWIEGRTLTTLDRGFTTLDSTKTLYCSNIDGDDMATDFRKFIEMAVNDKSMWNRPIKCFFNTGVYQVNARTEYAILFVMGGVPYILTTRICLAGTDEHDPEFMTADNSVIAQIISENAKNVASVGFVDPSENVTNYVSEFVKSNPVMKNPNISYALALDFSISGAMRYHGAIYKPGAFLYDIFTTNRVVSLAIRPNKDFATGDTMNENASLPDGMEILLVGGEPDLVSVGTVCTPNGCMFDVWVPNRKNFYKSAVNAMANEYLPCDAFELNEEDFIKSYAILVTTLREIDEERNGPDDDEMEADGVNATMITDEVDDGDEAPVLIELPEYLI